MTLAARPRSTAADLLRLLALWLAVILLVQGFGAAQALGAGPLHRHAPRGHEAADAHAHANSERHHHATADRSVVLDADISDALELAASALVFALALMAPALPARWADGRRHDRPTTTPRPARGIHPEPLLRPPRPD